MSESITLPIESINLIDDPVAMSVWAYILSEGELYAIKNEIIQKRFGIGRDKTTSAFKKLKAVGLMSDDICRSESGKIVSKELRCHLKPIER